MLKPPSPQGDPCRLHGNARLTPRQRTLMCRRVREEGWTVAEAAEAAGCSERTVYRWLARCDAGERDDGSVLSAASTSEPHPAASRGADRAAAPAAVHQHPDRRRARAWRPRRCARCSRGSGLNRLSRLGPPEPPNRYCRRHPGELVHIDVKKLGRFNRPGHRVTGRGPGHPHPRAGWEPSTSRR